MILGESQHRWGNPSTGKSGLIDTFHGARDLFAAQILVFHLFGADWPHYSFAWTGIGRLAMRVCEYGVELFFCVSGYAIVQSMNRAAGPLTFLRARALRIVPLLWINIAASGIAGLLSGQRQLWSLGSNELVLVGLANMLALPGIFPVPTFNPATWSLSYEALFYCFCALWMTLGRHHLSVSRIAILTAVGIALLIYPRALPFVVGLLVGLKQKVHVRVLESSPGLMIVAFLAIWAVIQALTADDLLLIDTTLVDWSDDLRLPLAIVALCALTFGLRGLLAGNGVLGRFLTSSPMQFLGTISYSFYLWQNSAIGMSRRLIRVFIASDPQNPLGMTIFPILTIVILLPLSMASHKIIEVYIPKLIRKRFNIA